MERADVLIIGAGASGLAAAVSAHERGERVLLWEAGNRPGRKILASGNGRCNLMNMGNPVYYGDTGFAADVLRKMPVDKLTDFWRKLGLEIRVDGNGRAYPCSNQASTVLEVLMSDLMKHGVRIRYGCSAELIQPDAGGYRVFSEQGDCTKAGRVIVATGGPAQPKLGGRESVIHLLAPLGHTLVPFSPVLTPLETDRRSVSGLSGIRIHCELRLVTDGSENFREKGELLFSDDGISGICVMQSARFAVPGHSVVMVNPFYDLYASPEEALEELLRRQAAWPGDEPDALLRGLCVPKFAFAICKQAGLSLRGETAGRLDREELLAVAKAMTGYRLPVTGKKGFDRAQVSAGGLLCEEWNPENMESRLWPGLHASGEAMNVDGTCGGFNLMYAWASGILAGLNGRESTC